MRAYGGNVTLAVPCAQRRQQVVEPAEECISERIRAIPEGFVRTYGDIWPSAPRLVGRILATTSEDLPWHRVVRADGSVAKGTSQLTRLRREGVPLKGARVDLAQARMPH
jgi:methylated-DNA-protein-cysteine methyltransferase related protein